MKSLTWPTKKEESEFVRTLRNQKINKAKGNSYVLSIIPLFEKNLLMWTQHAIWGFRVYDFLCSEKGVVIQIQESEEDYEENIHGDEYHFRRSGLVVLRLNRDDDTSILDSYFSVADMLNSWQERKYILRLDATTRKERRWLSSKPDFPYMLPDYLKHIKEGKEWDPKIFVARHWGERTLFQNNLFT